MHEASGIPLAEGLDSVLDLPHTISFAILYRKRIDSFNELPKDKRPPRNLWDKPHRLGEFLETIWDKKDDSSNTTRSSNFYDYDLEDVE